MFDEEAFGAAMGEMVREAVQPLHDKIKQLEDQLLERPDIDALVKAAVAAVPPAQNGKRFDIDTLKSEIEALVKSIPVVHGKDGADGKSVTLEDVQPILDAAIIDIRKDASALTERVLNDSRLVLESSEKAIRELRQPEDGKPGKDGADGKDGEPGAAGAKGLDGIGLAGAMIDRDGALMVTLANGEVKSLGQVVGKDGTQGEKGADGRDGMGFDDLNVEYDGEKTITLKMQRGDVTKEANIVMPINIDRDVFKEGQAYQPGDCVTWAGSYWVAKRQSGAKPDSPDSGFRLVAKKGRDGRDGRNGIDKTATVKVSQ